jgi:valyl-tRNA synthetase
VKFVPDRWTKVYLDWMENIRDWCISRQIWWGHRIPVFTCEECGREWAAKGIPAGCPGCRGGRIRQDEDVLDTWFSSWLWPFSTFGWPGENEDLKFYYPTNDLVTASEIIFFWVARMIMAGYEFMGDAPFRTVYIHGTVRADDGRKMSKSLGNSIDPLDVIDAFSADALRCSLMMITATGQDLFLSNDKFEIGRNFGTKIWNAARFLSMQDGKAPAVDSVGPPAFDAALLSPDDIFILAKLQDCIRDCTANLEKFRLNDATLALHDFIWHEFCDWHVECAKPVLYGDDAERRQAELRVMHYVLSTSLRLLHPVMPFLTEELWHEMGYGGSSDFIMKQAWPVPVDAATLAGWGANESVIRYVSGKHDMVRAGRALKADFDIPAAKEADYVIAPASPETALMLERDLASVKALLRAGGLNVGACHADSRMPGAVSPLGTISISLSGVDIRAEIARLAGQIEKSRQDLARIDAKLANESFTTRAPADVVARQHELRKEIAGTISKLQDRQAAFSRAGGAS